MPRTGRELVGGVIYHIINRGNGRAKIFKKEDDYREFIELMQETKKSHGIFLYSFCLMPNHFHLLLKPREGEDLSSWLRTFTTKQVRLYHKRNGSSGHLWQGRYKSFPVQKSESFEVVMRYIERNPLRANLVEKAQDWKWSSLHLRSRGEGEFLTNPPIPIDNDWASWVNAPLTELELEKLRNAVNRCCPFGSERWMKSTALKMGLESTLRPKGRPKNIQ